MGFLDYLFGIAGTLPSMGGANIQWSLVIKGGGDTPLHSMIFLCD